MARESPLRKQHLEAEASFTEFGPVPDEEAPERTSDPVELIETFGELHAEYAAIRKGCALFDLPQQGIIRVRGADRLEFLDRMITQQVRDMTPHEARRSFWLNRKGRIDADLRLIQIEDEAWMDVNLYAVPRTIRTLDAFLFADDVQLTDETDAMHRLALHGPTAIPLLAEASEHVAGAPLTDLSPGRAATVRIGPHEVIVDREDSTGEVGLHLLLPAAAAPDVWRQLIEIGSPHENGVGNRPREENGDGSGPQRFRMRAAGWHAFNIARIEAGIPLYYLDYGPTNLPHETGVVHDRIRFDKGCYLGQEVVARMESLGHPRQILRCLRVADDLRDDSQQPVTGDRVYPADQRDADPIGAVTSSTVSPMLGQAAVCFAQVKWKHADPGTRVDIEVSAERIGSTIQPRLAPWTKSSAG